MKATRLLKKTDIFQGGGTLPEVADRATAAGFRYFILNGKVFEVETERVRGSSLGVHSIRGAELTD